MIVIPFLKLHLKDYCKFRQAQKDRRVQQVSRSFGSARASSRRFWESPLQIKAMRRRIELLKHCV
jgi:hypothetical protein